MAAAAGWGFGDADQPSGDQQYSRARRSRFSEHEDLPGDDEHFVQRGVETVKFMTTMPC